MSLTFLSVQGTQEKKDTRGIAALREETESFGSPTGIVPVLQLHLEKEMEGEKITVVSAEQLDGYLPQFIPSFPSPAHYPFSDTYQIEQVVEKQVVYTYPFRFLAQPHNHGHRYEPVEGEPLPDQYTAHVKIPYRKNSTTQIRSLVTNAVVDVTLDIILPGDTITSESSRAPETPVERKVMVINFNPFLEAHNMRLNEYLGWNDPITLQQDYINTMLMLKNTQYTIVETHNNIDDFPIKETGFDWTDEAYLDCWLEDGECNDERVNYLKLQA